MKIVERDRVTIFQGVPTMYVAMLAAGSGIADTSSLRSCISGGAALPAEVLKNFHATFGAYILEGYGLSETSPVASFNHAGDTPRQLDRQARRRRGDEGRRRRGQRGGHRRGRGDRHQGPQHHEGLLEPAGGHRRGDPRGLVPQRRHGPQGRGRVLLHRRPQEGADHPRRVQRLPTRDRGGPLRASGGPRSRRHRCAAPHPRRGGRRRGGAQAGRIGLRGRAARLRQGTGRGLQVPAPRLAGRRPAEGGDGQDPQARDHAACDLG